MTKKESREHFEMNVAIYDGNDLDGFNKDNRNF
jgi:hypothetical protein